MHLSINYVYIIIHCSMHHWNKRLARRHIAIIKSDAIRYCIILSKAYSIHILKSYAFLPSSHNDIKAS